MSEPTELETAVSKAIIQVVEDMKDADMFQSHILESELSSLSRLLDELVERRLRLHYFGKPSSIQPQERID